MCWEPEGWLVGGRATALVGLRVFSASESSVAQCLSGQLDRVHCLCPDTLVQCDCWPGDDHTYLQRIIASVVNTVKSAAGYSHWKGPRYISLLFPVCS